MKKLLIILCLVSFISLLFAGYEQIYFENCESISEWDVTFHWQNDSEVGNIWDTRSYNQFPGSSGNYMFTDVEPYEVNGENYSTKSWITSPLISMSNYDNVFLKMDHYFIDNAYGYADCEIQIRNSAGTHTLEAFADDAYGHKSYDITAYTNGYSWVKISFYYEDYIQWIGAGIWEIDNIEIEGFSTDHVPGTALSFDGTDDYTDLGEHNITGNYTIETWFKTSSTVDQTLIGGYQAATPIYNSLQIEMKSDGKIRFMHREPAYVGSYDVTTVNSYNDGQWHHLAAIKAEDEIKLLVDDEYQTNYSTNIDDFAVPVSLLGGRLGILPHMTDYYSGSLDEVRIWNTDKNFVQIYESEHLVSPANEPNLISYFQFNESSGTDLIDWINYDTPGTNYGASRVTSTAPFGKGNAHYHVFTGPTTYSFPGTDYSISINSMPAIFVVTASKIDVAPNVLPDCDNIYEDQYWIIHTDDLTWDADAAFIFPENITSEDELVPHLYKLYSRETNAIGSWTKIAEADAVNSSSNSVTFNSMVVEGQFIISKIAPPDTSPGYALDFDGIDDYVIVSSDSELRPANNFTIEVWIKPNNIIENQVIFMHDENGGGDDGYALYIYNEDVYFSAHNGSNQTIISDERLTLNCWNHLAAVYDNSTLKIYVNGIEKTQAGSGNIVYSVFDNVNIGRRGGTYHPNTLLYEGLMDEIRLWNVVRTEQQIRENMNLSLTGNEIGILGYWQLNDGSGTIASDWTENNNGTLMNMNNSDWITSTIPFGSGYSDTQTETTGTVVFTDTGVSMDFNSNNGASITVTKLNADPNMNPTELDETFDSQYWSINRFETGTFQTNITFAVNEDITMEDQNNPYQISLYKRSFGADGNWTSVALASSVNAAENSATCDNIDSFSQFIIGRKATQQDIAVNPTSLQETLMIGGSSSQTLNISNEDSFGSNLNYSIEIEYTESRLKTGRDISGSTFESNVAYYSQETTFDITFTIYNNSSDGDWFDEATINFPDGVNVNSSTNFSGGSGGAMETNANTGNGALITWTDNNGGYGNIYDGESAASTVNVSVDSGFSGDMILNWTLSGDAYGSAPHDISGEITIEQNPWLVANSDSGNCVNGETDNITLEFSTEGYDVGEYSANIIITSNDLDEPGIIIPVTLNILGNLDIPQNVTIETVGAQVQINWDEVTNANSYKIFSSDTPDGTFTEDLTGIFSGENWSVPISENKKFYYVKSSSEIIRTKIGKRK
ncbi:MAG: LamG domain-containing protein [Candidatus Cloacimonetes bacterium]|nr:LamG domain-containing protein [Candidatus Cloacimonadota bacterium]